jgi:hypothetical protein
MKKSKKTAKTKTSVEVIKLGTAVTDRASGISGVITLASVDLGCAVRYYLQPRKSSLATGHPAPGLWLSPQRLSSDGRVPTVHLELPLGVLGNFVEDTLSEMKGMVIAIHVHLQGCVHVIIQPAGTTIDDVAIGLYECDYRRIKDVPGHPAADKPSPMPLHPVPSIC